jgi:hypothetical protein
MLRPRLLHGLSPGERAFDRCIMWFVFILVLNTVVGFVAWAARTLLRHTDFTEHLPGISVHLPWEIWLPFALGIVLAAYWVWAFRGVVENWSDPVARILRFSSLALLLAQLFTILSLLSSPLVHLLNSSVGH